MKVVLDGVFNHCGSFNKWMDRECIYEHQQGYEKGAFVDAIDALSLAEEAGSSKAVNIVLMGKVAKQFGISYDKWITAIENTVAPKFVEMNKKAFDLGYNS